MNVFKDYSEYRSYKPQYEQWKANRNTQEAKRAQYVKQNGVSDAQKQKDIKRANAVLDAVDIIDDYSQSRAEDMEVATEPAKNLLMEVATYAGLGVGLGLSFIPPIRKGLTNLATRMNLTGTAKEVMQLAPVGLGMVGALLATIPITTWGTKKEIGASRAGRYEAMQKDLSNVKHFAVLTDEQTKEVEEKAKTIKLTEQEKKKTTLGDRRSVGGIFGAFKDLLIEDTSYFQKRNELNDKIAENKTKFDKVQLTEQDIEDAKRDQQLIGNVVEKIDIASQEYAENVELLTNSINAVALGGGGILGFGTNKILSALKLSPKTSKIASMVLGGGFALASIILSVKLQKQASKVARFKVKEDFRNNPDKILYVEDEKLDGVQLQKQPAEKKPGYFAFLKQVLQDNKDYDNYVKTKGIEDKKRRKAVEGIEITKEQEREAKRLQENVFKTFNEVDEKSQKYAESTEAAGEIIKSTVGALFPMIGMGLGFFFGRKNIARMFESAGAIESEKQAFTQAMKMMKTPIIGTFIGAIPAIALDAYVTKEQKNASRVANMLGLEELKDYRNYADYSPKPEGYVEPRQISSQGNTNLSSGAPSNMQMSSFLQKMIAQRAN